MKPHLSIRQLIRLSLAAGLLAAFLAPGPAQAQGPLASQGIWQTFTTANSGLRDDWVTALLEDRAGGIWVGTRFGGVNRYFEGTWQTFSVESGSLAHNSVWALLEDRAGGLWVGTGDPLRGGGGGVSRYFQGVWQTFSTQTGSLRANSVTALLEDRAGGLWVGTFWGGVSYHRMGSYQPWVLLHRLEVEREGRVQGYDLSGGEVPEVALDFPVERLTIRFVGADLDSYPSNIRYFYQLEGWDTARHPTAQGMAQYTNLPPGRYTFVVQSLDEDLTFSPEARLAIVIPAPFWRTGWFWGGGSTSFAWTPSPRKRKTKSGDWSGNRCVACWITTTKRWFRF